MENYQEIINSGEHVLVEFFATWCPHCRKMMPVVAEVKDELEGVLTVCQLDIDKNQEMASEAGVDGVPTFILYKNGKEVWRQSGEMPLKELLENIRDNS